MEKKLLNCMFLIQISTVEKAAQELKGFKKVFVKSGDF